MGKRRDRGSIPRFVWLRFWLMDSPAWCSLPCNARALYVQLSGAPRIGPKSASSGSYGN
jgi:hypothetical protein